jgi:hypothetical protein
MLVVTLALTGNFFQGLRRGDEKYITDIYEKKHFRGFKGIPIYVF